MAADASLDAVPERGPSERPRPELLDADAFIECDVAAGSGAATIQHAHASTLARYTVLKERARLLPDEPATPQQPSPHASPPEPRSSPRSHERVITVSTRVRAAAAMATGKENDARGSGWDDRFAVTPLALERKLPPAPPFRTLYGDAQRRLDALRVARDRDSLARKTVRSKQRPEPPARAETAKRPSPERVPVAFPGQSASQPLSAPSQPAVDLPVSPARDPPQGAQSAILPTPPPPPHAGDRPRPRLPSVARAWQLRKSVSAFSARSHSQMQRAASQLRLAVAREAPRRPFQPPVPPEVQPESQPQPQPKPLSPAPQAEERPARQVLSSLNGVDADVLASLILDDMFVVCAHRFARSQRNEALTVPCSAQEAVFELGELDFGPSFTGPPIATSPDATTSCIDAVHLSAQRADAIIARRDAAEMRAKRRDADVLAATGLSQWRLNCM